MSDGYELRKTSGKGQGVFAKRKYKTGDIVMIGIIENKFSENNSHASQIGENEYALHAGLIRMVNHSCNPNCGIRLNQNGGHDFVAMKDTNINEEIVFDYAMRNYSVDYFPNRCMCGSEMCRGKISGWKELSLELKEKYKNFVAPYLLELDAKYSRELEFSLKNQEYAARLLGDVTPPF